jgi:hypothetical protein
LRLLEWATHLGEDKELRLLSMDEVSCSCTTYSNIIT